MVGRVEWVDGCVDMDRLGRQMRRWADNPWRMSEEVVGSPGAGLSVWTVVSLSVGDGN